MKFNVINTYIGINTDLISTDVVNLNADVHQKGTDDLGYCQNH